MSAKAKPSAPPINRLEQTLRTIRYTRAHRNPPISQWEVLLTLAKSTERNGTPKPLSNDEISYAMGVDRQSVPLGEMMKDGLITVSKHGQTQVYSLTLKGEDQAVRLINGVGEVKQPTGPDPDMAKVSKFLGEFPKY